MASPSSPFCVNWSHKANTDEQIQWWELMRLLWVDSRNAAQRPPASHTWKSGGGDCYTPSWLPPSTPRWPAVHQAASHGINQEGGVMKAHVHTPWNTMSEPGRGRELSHLMLDSHLKLNFYFLVAGRNIDATFSAAKELNFDALSHLHPHQAGRLFSPDE